MGGRPWPAAANAPAPRYGAELGARASYRVYAKAVGVAGSAINFRAVGERVRFEVSLEAADKANLRLSSRLLALACSVRRASR